MIDVYDNVLEEHNAILIDDEVKKISWTYGYHLGLEASWHSFCGTNKEECNEAGYSWANDLFDLFMNKFDFKKKYSIDGYNRIHCNAHTNGLGLPIHVDDGDFTMIYYPRLDRKTEWGGGTAIFEELTTLDKTPDRKKEWENLQIDKHVNYKGNRLVVFDAYLPHQAQPVSRECYELRTAVVFKTSVSSANRERLDFYKNAIEQGNYKIKFA